MTTGAEKKQTFIASEYMTYLMNSGCCSQLMYRKLHVLACSTLGYYFIKDSFLKSILHLEKRRLKYFMILSMYDRCFTVLLQKNNMLF